MTKQRELWKKRFLFLNKIPGTLKFTFCYFFHVFVIALKRISSLLPVVGYRIPFDCIINAMPNQAETLTHKSLFRPVGVDLASR